MALPTLPTTFAVPYVTPTGSTINVGPADSLQTAITNANPGDLIVVDPGNTSGPINLPSKGGASYIYIISGSLASLPSEGTRVGAAAAPEDVFPAAQAALMPKIIVSTTNAAITCDGGAHHYRFVGFEIATSYAVTTATNFEVIVLEKTGGNAVVGDCPHDIVFDRCYIHGTTTGNCRRGIMMNGATIAVIDCYLSEFHEIGQEAQALTCTNGPGPFKIINNYLQAAGQSVLFGGDDPAITNLVPSDIEFKMNYCYKSLRWDVDNPFGDYAGIRWTIKNCFELKNAQRVWIDGNTFDRKWGSDAGQLHSIVFTVRDQNGGATWCVVQDVTFTNNVVTHVGGGIIMASPDSNFTSLLQRRILIKNNVFDINGTVWTGRGDGIEMAGQNIDVTIDHNTIFNIEFAGMWFTNTLATPPPAETSAGFVITNNIWVYAGASFFGDAIGFENDALTAYVPGFTVNKNAIIGGTSTNMPAGQFYPADFNAVQFAGNPFPDVRLARTSPLAGQATDGADIGKDFAAGEIELSEARHMVELPPAMFV